MNQEDDDVIRLVAIVSYCRSGWPECGTLPRVVEPQLSLSQLRVIDRKVSIHAWALCSQSFKQLFGYSHLTNSMKAIKGLLNAGTEIA